jgi:hypothetical protein
MVVSDPRLCSQGFGLLDGCGIRWNLPLNFCTAGTLAHGSPGTDTTSQSRSSCNGTALAVQRKNEKKMLGRDSSSGNPSATLGKYKGPDARGIMVVAAPAAVASKQLVDRACSPLVMLADGSPPPGIFVPCPGKHYVLAVRSTLMTASITQC